MVCLKTPKLTQKIPFFPSLLLSPPLLSSPFPLPSISLLSIPLPEGSKKDKNHPEGRKWSFNIFSYILPKKKNEAHLPDDKNPTVILHKNYHSNIYLSVISIQPDYDNNKKKQSATPTQPDKILLFLFPGLYCL